MKLKVLISVFLMLSKMIYAGQEDYFKAYILIDSSENSQLGDVINSQEFKNLSTSNIYSNFTKNTFWIKIIPRIPFNSEQRIGFSNAYNHYETIHIIRFNGEVVSKNFGINQPYSSSTYLPSFPLQSDIKELYIQIQSNTFLYESFEINSESRVLKRNTYFTILQVFSFLFIFIIIIYLSILYYKTKKAILGDYLIYVISAGLMMLFISNFGRYFLWSQLPFSMSYLEILLSWFMVIAYLNLTIKITEISTYFPILKTIARAFLAVGSIVIIITFFISHSRYLSLCANILPLFAIFQILVFTIVAITKKSSNAKIYLYGILFFLAGMTMRIMINWGVISYSILAESLVLLGLILELVLFTYAVIGHVETQLKNNSINLSQLDNYATQIEKLQLAVKHLTLEMELENSNESTEISDELNRFLHSPLTKRELEVLIELAKGGKHNEVADRLFISKSTLKTHISKIYTKLDTTNRIDAINKAKELTGNN